MSIFFLLYVFCFLLQESACCNSPPKEQKPKPVKQKKQKEKPPKKEKEKKDKKDKGKDDKKDESKVPPAPVPPQQQGQGALSVSSGISYLPVPVRWGYFPGGGMLCWMYPSVFPTRRGVSPGQGLLWKNPRAFSFAEFAFFGIFGFLETPLF